MARLRFTILGCGASPGVPRSDGDWGACDPRDPRNRRTRCSALIELFDTGPRPTRVLVDTGPDLRLQLLTARVTHLDAVIYTHSHADHVHGIDDLRPFWISSGRLIDVFTDEATQARLEAGFGYCFQGSAVGNYPPILRRNAIIPGEPIRVAGPGGALAVTPFRQLHGDTDSLGLRVAALAYCCDVSDFPPESLALLGGLDLLVIGALRDRPHPSHFTVAQALAWVERLRPGRAVLTHMHGDLDYETLCRRLPKMIGPAYDGMAFEFTIPEAPG